MPRPLALLFFVMIASIAGPSIAGDALYSTSVVGTDFDFITGDDPSAFDRLEYVGRQLREMVDKRPGRDELFKTGDVFTAFFRDNTRVTIIIDAAFGSEQASRDEAMRYAPRLGKLPTALRRGIDNSLVVHRGGDDTTAFSDQGLIIVYAGNATKRIATHDLEETLFHESIHAAWDAKHARSPAWRAAQEADGRFVTQYAERKPGREDLAESALFAYTLTHQPGRIPPADAAAIRAAIPNRIAYVAELIPAGKPVFYEVAGDN